MFLSLASRILEDDGLETFGINTMPAFGLFIGLLRIYTIYAKSEVLCDALNIKKICDAGKKHQCCKGKFITPIHAASQATLALTQIPRRQYDRPPDWHIDRPTELR